MEAERDALVRTASGVRCITNIRGKYSAESKKPVIAFPGAILLYGYIFLGSPIEMPSLTEDTSEWALHVGILHEMHV